jgi:hypothetical protein
MVSLIEICHELASAPKTFATHEEAAGVGFTAFHYRGSRGNAVTQRQHCEIVASTSVRTSDTSATSIISWLDLTVRSDTGKPQLQ